MKLWLRVRICSAIGRAFCYSDDYILTTRGRVLEDKRLQGLVSLCYADKKRPSLRVYAVS